MGLEVSSSGCPEGEYGWVFPWNLDRGGIGGLIRDSKGKFLIQFSKEVMVDLVIHAEVLTFREGLVVFESLLHLRI